MSDPYWFLPHRYGLGAYPKNWKGWALVAAFVAAIFGLAVALNSPILTGEPKPLSFLVLAGVATAIFLFVCWRKTEGGWRWRWGGD